jgi:hypothetical protein
MGLGLMGCIITVILNNFFGDRWAYFELSAYLWIFAGLSARLIIISKEHALTPQTEPEIPNTPRSKIPAEKKKKKIRYYDL